MKDKLYIVWTNDNPDTSENMVCAYAQSSMQNNWWNEVTIIMWGAVVKYVANDSRIQKRLQEVAEHGVRISGCRSCAEQFDAVETIEALGFELDYWGESLTRLLKEDQKILTI